MYPTLLGIAIFVMISKSNALNSEIRDIPGKLVHCCQLNLKSHLASLGQ